MATTNREPSGEDPQTLPPCPAPVPTISEKDLKKLHKYQQELPLALAAISKQREFHYFPFLPTKLREEIWRLATPTPEVLRISTSWENCPHDHDVAQPGSDNEDDGGEGTDREDGDDDYVDREDGDDEYIDREGGDDEDTDREDGDDWDDNTEDGDDEDTDGEGGDGGEDEDDNREDGSSSKAHLCQFTYTAAEKQFGITECCKEARHITRALLPMSLATDSTEARIRFDPSITAVYIDNFGKLLRTADPRKCERLGETWFCDKSCIGSGITKLVVSAEDLWCDDPKSQFAWDMWRWVELLRKMFKDVMTIVVLVNIDSSFVFDEAYFEWDSDNDSVNEGDPEEAEDEEAVGQDTRGILEHSDTAAAESGPLRRYKEHPRDTWYRDIDYFEAMLNDHFSNIVDDLERYGCFNANDSDHRQRPHLQFHEGSYLVSGLDVFKIPVRPAEERFDLSWFYDHRIM
ncbi:hypothetical protein N431DRAFT_449917 [Stipitochalara longipes BDJ]|nr:hypothetical protein N431DRAFT_449917 [Stipitochalara longipes BDJ]